MVGTSVVVCWPGTYWANFWKFSLIFTSKFNGHFTSWYLMGIWSNPFSLPSKAGWMLFISFLHTLAFYHNVMSICVCTPILWLYYGNDLVKFPEHRWNPAPCKCQFVQDSCHRILSQLHWVHFLLACCKVAPRCYCCLSIGWGTPNLWSFPLVAILSPWLRLQQIRHLAWVHPHLSCVQGSQRT